METQLKGKLRNFLEVPAYTGFLLILTIAILGLAYPPILNYQNPLFFVVVLILSELFVFVLSIVSQWRKGLMLLGKVRYYAGIDFITIIILILITIPLGNSLVGTNPIIAPIVIGIFFIITMLLLELAILIILRVVGTETWFD